MSQTKAQLISTNILSGAGFAGIVTSTDGFETDGTVTANSIDTGNINSSGIVTASSFSGSGANLTGTAPNLNAAVGLSSNGESVGTATQINFIGSGNTISIDGNTATVNIRGAGVGIQSGGVLIGTGVTQFNFLGAGNTFAIVNDTVEVTVGGAGAGGGDFNSGISSSVTTKLIGYGATIFEAPALPSVNRYIIRSIMASNVAAGTTEVNVIGAIDYQGRTGYCITERSYFAYNVPISPGGAVEILPQPIVMGPEDNLLMRSTDYNRAGIDTGVEVHMTIEEKSSDDYFGFGLGDTSLGVSTATQIVYTSTDKPSIIQSLRACNKTNNGPHLVSVYTQTPTQTFTVVGSGTSTTNTDYYFTGSDRNGSITDTTDASIYVNYGDVLVFDMNETNASHPFQIVNAFGGAGFTTGITGAGTTTITLDTSFLPEQPGTYHHILYYECTNHPNDMRGYIYVNNQDDADKPKYLIKNLIIPKYGVVELLDKPKRIETDHRIGIGVSSGQSIHLQISGIRATD